MATLIPDSIDFSAYMDGTDHAHKVRPASAFIEDVIAEFKTPQRLSGDPMPWPKTHELLRFRPGEVTLWTGYNGSGKSLVLGQVCLGLVRHQRVVCIASMEMQPKKTLKRMCQQSYAGEQPPEEFIRNCFNPATNRRLWLYDQHGTVKAQKLLAVIRYCADQLAIRHFVVDSLLKCGIGEDDFNGQKGFVDNLCSIARDSDIHVHLVAHSRKGDDEDRPPRKMDVKGSGSITDQVDNVISVWRNKPKERDRADDKTDREREPDALLICDKQRNGDWEGKIALWFDPRSTQYLESRAADPAVLLPLSAEIVAELRRGKP